MRSNVDDHTDNYDELLKTICWKTPIFQSKQPMTN